jgi:hypothetical protein
MPSLSQISNNFFLNLINRLGVRPPPAESFLLSNVVQPVSIVDADIVIPAVVTSQTLDTPFTVGSQALAAANTVLADTGALVAGTYLVYVTVGKITGANAMDFRIQRRDAANAVNVWDIWGTCDSASQGFITSQFTAVLLVNERIRVIENTLSTTTAIVNIFVSKL